RAREGPARHHVVQPQLAEPDGVWRRGVSGVAVGRGLVGAGRLHGAAERARDRVGPGAVRGLRTCRRSVRGGPALRAAVRGALVGDAALASTSRLTLLTPRPSLRAACV